MMEKSAHIRREKLKSLENSQAEMMEKGTHPNQTEFDKSLKFFEWANMIGSIS